MTLIVLSAILVSIIVYLGVGFYLGRNTKSVGDMLPMMAGQQAQVANSNEFSASTVATTISLATVVVAFFELSAGLGTWLLWCVVTTSLGLFVMRIFARKIWDRMATYENRPSIHEFLEKEYQSSSVGLIASVFTSIGYLTAFATELTVGSRFLAGLLPEIPQWAAVLIVSVVGFIYTSAGGFRSVVVTDRIQMWSIWLLIGSLSAYYVYFAVGNGGIAVNIAKVPAPVLDFSWREGLGSFLIGIFIMNVAMYLPNMSLWQRIAGSQKPEVVVNGLWGATLSSALAWGMFVVLACFALMIVQPAAGQNLLTELLIAVEKESVIGKVVLFCVTLGLYGAMLSTASTQLIAVSHTIYEDIIAKFRSQSLTDRLKSGSELRLSRIILITAAIVATVLVEVLRYLGFSVADLAFAIYGSSLALLPALLLSLYLPREQLKGLKVWANSSVTIGFVLAWVSAIVGRSIGDGNLVFLAPVVGTVVAFVIMAVGYVVNKK